MASSYAAHKLDSIMRDLSLTVRQAGTVARYGMGQATEEDVLRILGDIPVRMVSQILGLSALAGGRYDTGDDSTPRRTPMAE